MLILSLASTKNIWLFPHIVGKLVQTPRVSTVNIFKILKTGPDQQLHFYKITPKKSLWICPCTKIY